MLAVPKQHVLWLDIYATLTRNLPRYVENCPSLNIPLVLEMTSIFCGPHRLCKLGGKFKSKCNSERPCWKQRLLSQCLKRKGKMSIYGMENWFWREKGDKVFIQFEWRIGQNVSPCTIHSLHFTQILSNKSYAINFFYCHILCSHWIGIRITAATIRYFERGFF